MSPPPAPRKPSRPGDPEAFGAQLDELIKGLEAEEPGILRRGKTYHAQQQAKAGVAQATPAEPADPPPVPAEAVADPGEGDKPAGETPAPPRASAEPPAPADRLVDRQIEQRIDAAAADAAAQPASNEPDHDASPQDPADAQEGEPASPPCSALTEASRDTEIGDTAEPPSETSADATFEHQLEDLLAQIKPVSDRAPEAADKTDAETPDEAAVADEAGPAAESAPSADEDLADLSAQLQGLMAGSQAGSAEPASGDPGTAPERTSAREAEAADDGGDTAEAASASPAESEPPPDPTAEPEVDIEDLDDLLAGEPIDGDFESIEDLAEDAPPGFPGAPEGASGAEVASELDTQPENASPPEPMPTRASTPEPAERRRTAGRHARRLLATVAHCGERGAYHGCRLVNRPLTRLAPAHRTAVGWIGLLTLFNGVLVVAFALLT